MLYSKPLYLCVFVVGCHNVENTQGVGHSHTLQHSHCQSVTSRQHSRLMQEFLRFLSQNLLF